MVTGYLLALVGVVTNPDTTPIGRPCCLGAIGFTSTLRNT